MISDGVIRQETVGEEVDKGDGVIRQETVGEEVDKGDGVMNEVRVISSPPPVSQGRSLQTAV